MNDSLRTFKLKCEDCGGEMSINGDRNVVVCPFCGSTKLIIEDKDVVVERIRNESIKDTNNLKREELRLKKEALDFTKEQFKYQQSRDRQGQDKEFIERFRKGVFSKIMIVFAVLSAITALGGFSNCSMYDWDYLPSSLLFLAQSVSNIIALLIGYGVLRLNRLVFILAIIGAFGFCFLGLTFVP
ncbi:hypothetical protein [Butyrivibrio sp. MC2013]|uniref:hypothetical protein n=1 Tax=Butyrivibrio sp. MC2013 TaxID=1280686 RepID=UPI00047A96FA|nr:hypothetical protein [Butyrivibrio sp. MC2013]